MVKRFVFIFLCLLSVIGTAYGQHTLIKGVVTDSLSGERLPYVSLIFKGTTIGTSTGLDGTFSFSTDKPGRELEVSYLGYDTKHVRIRPGRTNTLEIALVQSGITLNEVTIKPTKERYKKKGNPAVEFVKQVIERRSENTPYEHDYFSYDKYEKILIAKNDYQSKPKKADSLQHKPGKFDFLSEFVDTLDTGGTILPLSERETIESVFYRKDPKSEKRLVRGSKSAGVDEVLSRDGMQQFLHEVFREVDIYQNNIPLFLQRFVSPLSSMGPNFYKYYLMDTLNIAGKPHVDLGFAPFNSESFGFTGHLYVALDSTYFVHRAVLNVPKDINLNFVYGMRIEQAFERTPDGTRLITKDDITGIWVKAGSTVTINNLDLSTATVQIDADATATIAGSIHQSVAPKYFYVFGTASFAGSNNQTDEEVFNFNTAGKIFSIDRIAGNCLVTGALELATDLAYDNVAVGAKTAITTTNDDIIGLGFNKVYVTSDDQATNTENLQFITTRAINASDKTSWNGNFSNLGWGNTIPW